MRPSTHSVVVSVVFLLLGAQGLRADHFSATGSMSLPRSGHTATLLSDGRVLVAGGLLNNSSSGVLKTAEIYDPSTGRFSSTGSMAQPRANAVATRLADGRVLVTGGFNFTAETFTNLPTAEIYDPASGQFSGTGSMSSPRTGHSATLLHDGRVFIVGGTSPGSRQAEIYNPNSSTFTTLAQMLAARGAAVAFTLPNGNVLVAGGNIPTTPGAEIFNLSTGQFQSAPQRTLALDTQTHGRAVLSSGVILFAGSIGVSGVSPQSELFDPASGTFLPVGSMNISRSNHAGAALADGRAVVSGGSDQSATTTSSAELFDPTTRSFRLAASMLTPRAGHTTTTLQNGTVLIVGGANSGVSLSSAETYVPDTATVPDTSRRRAARH